MAIREVLTSFTFEQQRLMINLIGTDVGDTSTLLTPTNVVVPALNEIVNGDVDLVNQTHGMDPGTSGSPSLYWDAGQGFYKVDATKIGLTSSLAITGSLEVDGDITFRAGAGAGGTLTFGDLDTDNIIFNEDVQSSIVPDTTANYNLGSVSKQWNNLWIDGTASIDTLTVDENSQFIGYITVGSGDIRVPSTQTTVDLFDDYATTVEAFGDATSIRIGDTTGTLTLRNPTIVGSETTQNLFNTVATTVNAFGAATTINIGVSGGGGNSNLNIFSDDVVCSGDLNINGGELLSQQTTFNLLINNDNINVGNTTGQGTTTINNRLQINGNLAIGGTSTYIELPDNQTNAFRFREGSNDYLQFRTEDGLERVVVWKDLYVVGNLDVSGTETVIDTTTLLVEDKNIELGATSAPSDATADGGGITLKATTDKTITYNNTDTVWETNIGLKVVSSGAKGIRSHVPNAQATDTNKALRVTNGSDVDTFNVSYKGAVTASNNITCSSSDGNYGIYAPGSIELYRSQLDPFIDFKNASGDDFDIRVQQVGDRLHTSIAGRTGSMFTVGGDKIGFGPTALIEKVRLVSGKLSDNQDIDVSTYGNVYLHTIAETTTSTPNIRSTSSATLNSLMADGEAMSLTIMTTAAAAGYFTTVNIDGNANGANGYTINVDWLGGSAPTAGGSAGIDVYSVTIIKQSSQNFNVLASVQNYA